jgi:Na+/H+-dicarboxylate symporter
MKLNEKYQLYAIAIGAVLGIFSGWLFGPVMSNFTWLGTFFLNLLKMIIIPLLLFSVIIGMIGISKSKNAGTTGIATILYYTITTSIAVLIGLILVNLIQPGIGEKPVEILNPLNLKTSGISLGDMMLSLVSENIILSMTKMELLPVITFSILIGFTISKMANQKKVLIEVISDINEVILKLVDLILWLAPIGIFALISSKIGSIGRDLILFELSRLGKYGLTVVIGLGIHAFVVLPVILFIMAKRNPLIYFKNSLAALITAFSTASSSATLPINIECAEKNNNISKETAGFVLPLGATMNMDGTALYEAVAAIYISQIYGISLSLNEQFIIFLTSSLASIGAAGIPEAGLITMTIVLSAVGLPLEGLSMIIAIDWILDRSRTSVNVWGDSVGAAVIDNFYLKKIIKN